jgi:biopolymer transport protein ExbB
VSKQSPLKAFFSGFAGIAIPVLFVVAILIYIYILGDGSNFQKGDNANDPLPGNYLGMVYKGGFIVPILITAFLTVWTFAIERFIVLSRAKGKGNVASFIARVYTLLSGKESDLDIAIAECDKQRGSVANVVKAGLLKYKEVLHEKDLSKDQKVVAIKQEFEEATSLELPVLEQNLVILSTFANLSTLIGLLGTVLGMIRAFAALANAGAPDASALATGISEALINTALGIGSSAFAIVFYNYFTTKIDKMTYSIDEAGVAITQQFIAKNK